MKVLQYPSYITIPGRKEFLKTQTGYGYMTLDIARSVAKAEVDVDILTQSNITSGLIYKDINILKRTLWDILSNAQYEDIQSTFKTIIKSRISPKKIPNNILYHISMGYFKKILTNNDYNLVHVHGIVDKTLPIINTCNKLDIDYLVTLHGLNSFSNSVCSSSRQRKIEKTFLKRAEQKEIPVSVISSGIRKKILDYLQISETSNFTVIPNGIDLQSENKPIAVDIRSKYEIPAEKKIMVCVGNIIANKNQIQVIRAYNKLPRNIREKLVILFLGKDHTNGTFQDAINKSQNSINLIHCGYIPKENVKAYYSQSDYNIVASISEGFGLSMIEGFSFGLPLLTFKDLDAVPDLYNRKAMLLVDKRTDNALAEKIKKMLSKEWDRKFIKGYANKFSLTEMAQNYISLYKKIINKGK